MKVHPLDLTTAAALNATHYADITNTDLTAAIATQTLSPFAVAAKTGFAVVSAELLTAFVSSDATLISTAITIGDGGSANRFLTSMELNAAAATPVYLKGGVALSPSPFVYTVDDTIDVFVTGTAGKLLSSHTAGLLRIYGNLVDARSAS